MPGSKPKPLNDDRLREAWGLVTSAELAREMGVHRHTLLKRVRQLNLPGPHATGRPRILVGATRQAFLATCLAHPERSLVSICEEFGITERQGYRLRSQEQQAIRPQPTARPPAKVKEPKPKRELLAGDRLAEFLARCESETDRRLTDLCDEYGITERQGRRLRIQAGVMRKMGNKWGNLQRGNPNSQAKQDRAHRKVRRPKMENIAPTRWRCWRCERLVVELVCPGCQKSFGR